ncbi:MAG TPA: ABC transporter permease, partial [Blastocatellia bacterium]|nr:ABC transporter permease [Blastocatellia bacterium]
MTYKGLIWRNVDRNRRRSGLTLVSIALSFFTLICLAALTAKIDSGVEQSSPLRLITHHSVSVANSLPERYRSEIKKVPGVAAVTMLNWFGGIYVDDAHTDFAQYGCDPETFFLVYPEVTLSLDEQRAFAAERTAVIVSRAKAVKHGWRIGDRINLKGRLYPVDLELNIRGIFSGGPNNQSAVYFQRSYLAESSRRTGLADFFMIRADSVSSVPRVMQEIDDGFQNSD